mmetsp:Transcript_3436/g.13069  ORF Transcript_3436/g.13069 Transcript_3436/m.13069 type:complete len:1013 (-) Transcript_3436:1305-4343(-)|eukprot:CAMPEP_0117444210 /NCGR_PEP_ID=MMETSP0759-20121206/5115_1 /TAXON_ID=63605 /ORGANISM="Percolomonas cosmopolitus, Strain WS" /LENGTH=1012 /DNA_ID=CAMNT_0005236253 /DNA_START=270 /DNA_END=3308 /DNA_ORIENTATION=-
MSSEQNSATTTTGVQRDSAKKTERYSRRELIGVGAFKTVYKAYDAEEGREVAWNQVKLSNVKKQSREKILSEIAILEQLHHDRIMSIYDSWESEDGKCLVFITEIMSSGTLKDFLNKAKKIKMRNVKKWCTQILQGLHYLHKTDPHPIIHRDLKCDNIFMNGNRSEVKIGDLGLSISMKDKKFAVSVIGTPEFMAPELYDEHYTEKVDIYAFGMCVLEMVTGDYPYCECENPAQVYRRVSQGIKPKALDNIQDELTKEFIKVCLATSDQRPSAEQLLAHPFFSSERNNDITLYFDNDDEQDEELQSPRKHFQHVETPKSPGAPSEEADYTKVVVDELPDESAPELVVLKVFLNLQGTFKQIKFPYNKHEDTPDAVASEMAKKFELSAQHMTNIALGIATTIEELEKGHVILAEDISLAEADKGDDEFVLEEEGDEFSSESRSVTSEEMMLDDSSTAPSHVVSEEMERPKSAPTPDATLLDVSGVGALGMSSVSEELNITPADSLNVEAHSKDGDSVSSAPDNLESITFDTILSGGGERTLRHSPEKGLGSDKMEPVMSDRGLAPDEGGYPHTDSEIHDLSDLKELPKPSELPDLDTEQLRIDVNAPPMRAVVDNFSVFSDEGDPGDLFGGDRMSQMSNHRQSTTYNHWDTEPFTSTIKTHAPNQFMSEPPPNLNSSQHISSPQSDTPVEMLSRQQELYLQHKVSIEQRYQKQIDQLRDQIVDLQRRRDDEVDRLRHRSDAVNTSPLSVTSASSLPVDAYSMMDNSGFGSIDLQSGVNMKKGKLEPNRGTGGTSMPSAVGGGSAPQQQNLHVLPDGPSTEQLQAQGGTPGISAASANNVQTKNMPMHGRSSSAVLSRTGGALPKGRVREKSHSSRTHPRTGMTMTDGVPPNSSTHSNGGNIPAGTSGSHTTSSAQPPYRPSSQPNIPFANGGGMHTGMRTSGVLQSNPNSLLNNPPSNPSSTTTNGLPPVPTPNRIQLVDNFDSLVNVMKDSLRKAEESGKAPTLSQQRKTQQ